MATAFATTSAEVSRLLERGAGSTLSEEGILTFLEVRATRAEIQKLRRRLHAAIGVAREEGKSCATRRALPSHDRLLSARDGRRRRDPPAAREEADSEEARCALTKDRTRRM